MIDIRRGLEILKKNIRIAPEKPGVYRMLGEGGKVPVSYTHLTLPTIGAV